MQIAADMDVNGGVSEDHHRMFSTTNDHPLHASAVPPQPEAELAEDDDVMVDLSTCFGGGGCYNAAMEEADHQDLMDNAAAIFCDDLIPPLPDFQCMPSSSSSSSSSSSAAVLKPPSAYRSTASSSVSSSSASSWALLRSDDGELDNNNINNQQASASASYLQNMNNNHQMQATAALSSTASMDPMQQQNNTSSNNNNGRDDCGGDDDDGIGCMDDVMETLGYMDLLDENATVWDYNNDSSFHFQQNDDKDYSPDSNTQQQQGFEYHYNQQTEPHGADTLASADDNKFINCVHVNNNEKGDGNNNNDNNLDENGLDKSEDLAMVFFEWLKSNKESISAEDLRSIKLRKSTIESAAKRLGNGKEGMKRLLQLILEWVQHHQLQRKRSREEAEAAAATATVGQGPQFQPQMYPAQYPSQPFQKTTADSNLNVQPDQAQFVGSANHTHWNMNMGSGGGAGFDPMMAVGVPATGAGIIGGDPFGNNNGCHHFSNMVDQPAAAWPAAPPFCMNYNNNPNAAQNLSQQPYPFGTTTFNQYPYPYYPAVGNGNSNLMNGNLNEEGLARTGSSATKEARKKRMMRQRRFLPHHRHHNHNGSSNGHHHNNNGHSNHINMHVGIGTASSLGRFNVDENCANMANMGHPGSGNWTFWQNAAPPPPIPLVSNVGKSIQANDVGRLPLQQRPIAPERRQGSKPEKNLRFLLQKVLKQSDVGSLGRIVLPKKEAETHLPQLTARDGINIAMEDIGTSQVWNMRYRFWPNNKSRMYLLENTGDFVKSNGLQEGDFIVIYSDIKCGKYMIRGVKVRQQGPKSDARRCGKALKKNPSPTLNSSSPIGPPNKDTLMKFETEEPNMEQQMYA